MKPFLDKDFLLQSKTAERLYHEYAAHLPIIDYHCHLDSAQIANDVSFVNLSIIRLKNHHYKSNKAPVENSPLVGYMHVEIGMHNTFRP